MVKSLKGVLPQAWPLSSEHTAPVGHSQHQPWAPPGQAHAWPLAPQMGAQSQGVMEARKSKPLRAQTHDQLLQGASLLRSRPQFPHLSNEIFSQDDAKGPSSSRGQCLFLGATGLGSWPVRGGEGHKFQGSGSHVPWPQRQGSTEPKPWRVGAHLARPSEACVPRTNTPHRKWKQNLRSSRLS